MSLQCLGSVLVIYVAPNFYGRKAKALVHCWRPKEALQREAGPCSHWLLAKTQGKNPLSPLLERTLFTTEAMLPGNCLATVLYALAVGVLVLNAEALNVLNNLFTLTLPPHSKQTNKQTNKGINSPLIVFLILNFCSIWSFAGLANRKHNLDKRGPFWSFLLPWMLGTGL